MIFFWIVVIIVVVWWLSTRTAKKEVATPASSEKADSVNTITEEVVFKVQSRFEKKLQEEVDFPDAISGVDTYVYWKLMRPWYDKLTGENRYKEEMVQKLRNDWLEYMGAVGDRSTYNYLSLEFWDEKDSTKSDDYREKHVLASRKMFAIQDGFAAAVGQDAVAELKRVRELDFSAIDKRGNLASEGFSFDMMGELKPIETQ